jgi:enamine deaminase RidA (YjgF/YER057c/UK114 family)
MPKRFDVYFPRVKGPIEDEWKECLEQIKISIYAGLKPLKLNIFTHLPDLQTYLDARGIIVNSIQETLAACVPAVNVSVHPPAGEWKVAVEATFLDEASAIVQYKTFRGISYVVAASDDRQELWAGGISAYDHFSDTRKAASAAFDLAIALLASENMSADNIVRQWNFIGNILGINDGIQNYQVFNEVRNDYYAKFRKIAGFPAATGVGMRHGGVILDFCAIAHGPETIIKPVDNPNQVNAYNYGQQVLIGKNMAGVKHPPQFERALLISGIKETILHISGTASIVGQETIGRGDVEKQTAVTIENIEKLAGAAGLLADGNGLCHKKNSYTFFRVYVKNEDDFNAVQKICGLHFQDIPVLYVMADICRDDLLMEIEAEAVLG